jgi:O-antigen/teichoic acid export membrane protein
MSESSTNSRKPTSCSGIVTLRRIIVNTTSLLTSNVLNRAATFAVYAMMARYCGSRSFGQLSLGLMLLYTFQVFASAGLPTLITREVAKRPKFSGLFFTNASAIAVVASILSVAVLYLFAKLSRYPGDTTEIIMLLGLAILPWSLTSITEAVLQAWEQMHLIVFVAIPINALKVGISYWLLAAGYDVRSVTLVFLGCQVAALLLEWALLFQHIGPRNLRFDVSFCRIILARSWRFLGIDSLVAVWTSINAVLLSWFAGEAAVGVYAAAWQLLVPIALVLQAFDNSLFPIMCRRAEVSARRVQQLAVLMLELLAFVAVPGCILLYFGAGTIISTVYSHKDFASSVLVLRITLPVIITQAIANTFGQVLYSQRQEHATLRIVAFDVAFNLICGTALVFTFGLNGAAITALLTYTLNAYLHFAAARNRLRDETGMALPWNATLISQVVAAGCIMAGGLALLTRVNFFVASILTSVLYLIVLAAFVFVACRGTLGIRERFLVPLRD